MPDFLPAITSLADDRRGLGSVQAVLFGPYLLAGLTKDDWELRPGNSTSISDWIRAVPAEQNPKLVTLAQEFDDGVLVFSNSNHSIAMEEAPSEGSDAAVHASFRAIAVNSTTDNVIMLEPFDLPGMVVAARGPNGALIVSGDPGPDSTFRLVASLRDGKTYNTVSLESSIHPGCFVHGAADRATGKSVRLVCRPGAAARKEARFELYEGTRAYDPISFVARGTRRNFLLEPLINLKDETYTVYFNISV